MQEAQDSFEHSNTLPRESLSKSCLLIVWCFASVLRPRLRHPSPPPLALLSVPNFISYGSTLVTSPIRSRVIVAASVPNFFDPHSGHCAGFTVPSSSRDPENSGVRSNLMSAIPDRA